MSIDVSHFVWCHVGLREGISHCSSGLPAVWSWCGHMVGIVGETEATHLGVYRCPSGKSAAALLQNEHGRTFGHHKPIPAFVERPAGVGGIVVARRHGSDNCKCPETEWGQRRLRPTRHHGIHFAAHYGAKALANRDGPRGTAHPVSRVGAGKSELDGNVAAGGASKDREGQTRIDGSRASSHEVPILTLTMRNPAQRGAHHGPNAVRILAFGVEA